MPDGADIADAGQLGVGGRRAAALQGISGRAADHQVAYVL
jgi:hypothetical protein